MVEQALGELPQVVVGGPVARDRQQRVRDMLLGAHVQATTAEQAEVGVPQRLGSASRRASRSRSPVGQIAEPRHKPMVLGSGQELKLPELDRLQTTGRREGGTELQEVLRRHRLEHVDLADQQPLDHMGSVHQVPGQPRLARVHRVPGSDELVQQLLEPELVDLMHGDEQQLVVGRRIGQRHLLAEQVWQVQVGAVGEPAALLTEATPRPRRHYPALPSPAASAGA